MPSVTPTIPVRQTAVVVVGLGKLAIKHDVLVPPLAAAGAIVKVAAVAINPADAKVNYAESSSKIHDSLLYPS